jgi:hypothetical protein
MILARISATRSSGSTEAGPGIMALDGPYTEAILLQAPPPYP